MQTLLEKERIFFRLAETLYYNSKGSRVIGEHSLSTWVDIIESTYKDEKNITQTPLYRSLLTVIEYEKEN